jgi:glutathione S-transferase
MEIYGALLSPFVRKVCLVLEEKGLAYELHLRSPKAEDAVFKAISPFGKIPAMRDGDFALADSSAIAAYIEAKHPSPPLLPTEPQARGRTVWFDEFADTILAGAALKILFNRLVGPKLLKLPYDENVALGGEAELVPILAWLEGAVPPQGWLLGDDFTLADVAVASVFRSLAAVGHAPDAGRHPAIAAWYARVGERPAWRTIAEREARR